MDWRRRFLGDPDWPPLTRRRAFGVAVFFGVIMFVSAAVVQDVGLVAAAGGAVLGAAVFGWLMLVVDRRRRASKT